MTLPRTLLALSLTLALGLSAQAQDSRPTSRPADKRGEPGVTLDDPSGDYGAGLSEKDAATPTLEEVLANPKDFEGKLLRITGDIRDVCQKKGCWMLLGDGARPMRVKFKDYAFFVPLNSKGYKVTIEGTAKVVTITEEMAKHYAEESGDKEAAEKIKGPQTVLHFVAEGAKIHKKDAKD